MFIGTSPHFNVKWWPGFCCLYVDTTRLQSDIWRISQHPWTCSVGTDSQDLPAACWCGAMWPPAGREHQALVLSGVSPSPRKFASPPRHRTCGHCRCKQRMCPWLAVCCLGQLIHLTEVPSGLHCDVHKVMVIMSQNPGSAKVVQYSSGFPSPHLTRQHYYSLVL